MDIYRFFHPHHNPRLLKKAVRQVELMELQQASAELRKAVERARQRVGLNPTAKLLPEHFSEIVKALRFAEESLQTLAQTQAGDKPQSMVDFVEERRGLKGWEEWSKLLVEQLKRGDSAPEQP